MGQSWPTQMSRRGLGPAWKNIDATITPQEDQSAEQGNAMGWNECGMAATADRAWVVVSDSGLWRASGEVWNPDADIALRPQVARTSVGLFTASWDAEAYDEDYYDLEKRPTATKKPITLVAAKVFVNGATANLVGVAEIPVLSGSPTRWLVTVRITTANTGALTDAQFLLEVR